MRPSETLPYTDWFDTSYKALGDAKFGFLAGLKPIELSPAFEDFRPWLRAIQVRFRAGFVCKVDHEELLDMPKNGIPYNDETLGDNISYSSFIEPIHQLTGELKELVIRYAPPQPSLPTNKIGTKA
jgi:hypothetical protein